MCDIEDNKIIARRWLELISEHRIEDICEMTAPTWRMHGGLLFPTVVLMIFLV